MTGDASGALPHLAAIVAQLADRADRGGDRASGLADQVRGDLSTLLLALGGGPPAQLRDAEAQVSTAVAALGEAGRALHDAVAALRAFATRVT